MGADAEHDEPFRPLRSILISLGISKALPFHLAGFLDLVGCPVTDEHRFASPFDDDILSLGDTGELDLDFCEGEDISRDGHRA